MPTPPKPAPGTTAAKSRPAPAPAARKPAAPPRKAPARRRSRAAGPHLSFAIPPDQQREMVGVAVFVAAIRLALSLQSARTAGLVGALGNGLQAVFGVAAWIVPLALFAAAVMLFI